MCIKFVIWKSADGGVKKKAAAQFLRLQKNESLNMERQIA
jgi:hypothetical protein